MASGEAVKIMQDYFNNHDYPFIACDGWDGFSFSLKMGFLVKGTYDKHKIPVAGPRVRFGNNIPRCTFYYKHVIDVLKLADEVADADC